MHEYDDYKTAGYNIAVQKWYCPNCSALLAGYKDGDGKTRIKCPQCKTLMTKYRANRQVDIIELRMPVSCNY